MERRDKGQDIVLIASEPLTFERADWVTVPSNCDASYVWTLTVATLTINGQTVLLHPILGICFLGRHLIVDENYVADPLHVRRKGFAESKGQSSMVAAC
jgi:glutamine amidotransferase